MASDLSIYTTTFNCGRAHPNTPFLASNLFTPLTTNLPPDLIVLSLQELAPLAYAFLGGSLLAPYFSRFEDVIHIAATKEFGPEVQYETLVVRNVGLTAIMVFVRQEVARKVRWVRTGGVGVGLAETGNKGAVGVRVALEGEGEGEGEGGENVVLTFVAAHLAPMEDAWEERNKDWKSICEGLVFEPVGQEKTITRPAPVGHASEEDSEGEENAPLLSQPPTTKDEQPHTLFTPPTHLLFLGDLNYRTSDTPPSESTHQTSYPETLEPSAWKPLLATDQLTRERKAGRTLHNLAEAEIDFAPSYKYSPAAQRHTAAAIADTKNASIGAMAPPPREDVELFARHRWPAWCDRILYLAAAPPNVHAYDIRPIQPTCDHRPVVLSCSVPWRPVKVDGGAVKEPFDLRRDWRERRAAARRYEVVVGMAMFLGWTWEGEVLVLGSVVGVVGGWLLLRGLIGG